jgi:hypothetical protein
MNGHADQPVTQAEFTAAMGAIKQDLDRIDGRLDQMDGRLDQMATKDDLKSLRQDVREEITELEDRIIRHFNVVAENIHQDVAGANADRVSLLENQREEHEERLTTVEQRLGLRP